LRTKFPASPAAVRAGGSSELIDNDVVEGVGSEKPKVRQLAQRLDRGEQDIGVRRLFRAGVAAERGVWPDAAERLQGLGQDFLAVGDEQDTTVLGAVAVEGGQPGLAQAGRQDDEPSLIPCRPRLLQGA
jgi:hypothetical protein